MFAFMYIWYFWLAISLLVLFVVSVTYGWGYRGWGPPYPSYIQRRRMERAADAGSFTGNHQAWGRVGDFVWGLVLVDVFFIAMFLLAR